MKRAKCYFQQKPCLLFVWLGFDLIFKILLNILRAFIYLFIYPTNMFLQRNSFYLFILFLLFKLMLKVDDKSAQHDTLQNVFGIPHFITFYLALTFLLHLLLLRQPQTPPKHCKFEATAKQLSVYHETNADL